MVVNEQHFKSVQKVGFSQTMVFHPKGTAIDTGLSLIHIFLSECISAYLFVSYA